MVSDSRLITVQCKFRNVSYFFSLLSKLELRSSPLSIVPMEKSPTVSDGVMCLFTFDEVSSFTLCRRIVS